MMILQTVVKLGSAIDHGAPVGGARPRDYRPNDGVHPLARSEAGGARRVQRGCNAGLGGYEFLRAVFVEYPNCPLVITMMIIATIQ